MNSPATCHEGTLVEIRRHIPSFERQLDKIIRLPFGDYKAAIPICQVSKSYAFLPHTAVLDAVIRGLQSAGIQPSVVKAELKISQYGERMALSVSLPEEYYFDPGDSYPMVLRLECINSVDRSTSFRVLMSWYRLVSRSSLIMTAFGSNVDRKHAGLFDIEDVGSVLASGLKECEPEKAKFEKWLNFRITLSQVASWADRDLEKKWRKETANRVLHIARSGYEIMGLYKTQSTVAAQEAKCIRSVLKPCKNLFDLSQILAWMAKERHDIQEQLDWRDHIPELMSSLSPTS